MTDQPQPKSPGMRMSDLLRSLDAHNTRGDLLAALRRSWTKPTPKDDTTEETDRD